MKSEAEILKTLGIVTGCIAAMIMILVTALICTSCTISFQNISTNGKADDLVDQEQSTSADVKTDLTIPAVGI